MRDAAQGLVLTQFSAAAGVAVDHGSIGAKATLLATAAAGSLFSTASPRAALPAGIMYSHLQLTNSSADSSIALANLTAGAIDPAAQTYDLLSIGDLIRQSPNGLLFGSVQTRSVNHGSIGALAVLEAAATAITAAPTVHRPVQNEPVFVSPRTALPAGLALSHARASAAGVVSIGLANLTGGAIDPGAIQWDIATVNRNRQLRQSKSGRGATRFGAMVDSAQIPAASVLETSIDIPGTMPGDVVLPLVVANGPLTAGVAVSHARVSAPDTVALGLANLTGAPIDPPAFSFAFNIAPRLGPA